MKLFQKNREKQNFSDSLKNFLSFMQSFIVFIEKENKILAQGEVAVIKSTTEKKGELLLQLENIEQDIRYLYTGQAVLENQDIIEKIKSTYRDLQGVLYQNEVLLKSGIEINNKIIELYKAKRKKDTSQQLTYDKKGNVISGAKKLEQHVPAMALSNRF